MSATAANQARAAALKAARAKDSELKRRRALAALEALEATGAPITFTAVTKAAGVSTWLVYAEGIREHIDAARRRQAHHSAAPAPTPSGKHTTTSASLRTELAIARDQIKTLRAERDELQQRLRLSPRCRDRRNRPGPPDRTRRRPRNPRPSTRRRTRRPRHRGRHRQPAPRPGCCASTAPPRNGNPTTTASGCCAPPTSP